MHLHADFESLHKEVPKRLLPLEYGGEAGPLEVLIGECGVSLFCIHKFAPKKTQAKELSVDKNLELTQARPTVCVAYFDIETLVTLKPQLSLNLFKSRAYVQSSFE
jgi:hypothetical protein